MQDCEYDTVLLRNESKDIYTQKNISNFLQIRLNLTKVSILPNYLEVLMKFKFN